MSERHRPAWSIEPGRGIGPLRLGIPVDAAVRALDDAGLGPAERVRKGSSFIWSSHAGTVHVVPLPAPVPGAAETVAEIEVVLLGSAAPEQQPQAELSGHELLGQPLGDVREFLLSLDERAESRGPLVTAPGLGVRVWSGSEPPMSPVRSVTVTRPTPPARVIDPRCAFARLDRVARTLGFTGGATTVRPPLLAGEPEVAEWSRREILLRYSFDPVTFLRVLRLDGPEADSAPVVQRLLARLPLVTDEQVLADLDSYDDETAVRAIQAVGVLRLTAAREKLRHLSQGTRDVVRNAAVTTLIGLPDA
ncbi:hypothetical protein SAMN05421678_1045 [Actinopolymorpha cephalotaxi]|uniref:Uncharacterized protein n=1 Tax=Actinopolymorpha cephalotaxi TaxID=504797 RepID=A0A1I2PCK8_9ACTN|nr:hypothetical protein [Actinopolymorpha cephalotaxi]NYH83743.1 hypothetical protein [Actinopolymorpha cephalotaxi]SFG11406.1 hypothetical protein SAMN05421678_1045 [Actinopolymorpha cephalotaxi]